MSIFAYVSKRFNNSCGGAISEKCSDINIVNYLVFLTQILHSCELKKIPIIKQLPGTESGFAAYLRDNIGKHFTVAKSAGVL
jgi:hypothetical protein